MSDRLWMAPFEEISEGGVVFFIDLIYNLSLLAALSVLSGFLGKRYRQRWREHVLQGLLFGCVAVVGMLRPLSLGPGVIFDGRSVMISLCGLFFGPLAVSIAVVIAGVCRLCLGGDGQLMGILVIATSGALGLLFHYRLPRRGMEVSLGLLWSMGLLVHVFMVMLMSTLPYTMISSVLMRVAPPVLLIYPLATVLIGKVLSGQRERERFMAELQGSREELRTTLYSIGDGIITTDDEGRVRQLNPVAERLLGWTESEACGKHYRDVFRIVSEKTRDVVESPIERVLRDGRIVELTNHTLLLARDGSEYPIADSGAPIRNKEGVVVGVVLVFRDQSAERAAQRAVQTERDNLRAIMTASPVAIIVLNNAECVVDANPAAERVFGRKLSALGEASCGAFLGCVNSGVKGACGATACCPACAIAGAIREVLSTGRPVYDREVEVTLGSPGAERQRWLRFSVEAVMLDGRRHVLVAMNDFTQHRQTEEALRRIEWMLAKKPPAALSETGPAIKPEGGGEKARPGPVGRIGRSVSRETLESIVSEHLNLLGTATVIREANGDMAFRRIESGWCRMIAQVADALNVGANEEAEKIAGWLRCHLEGWKRCSVEAVASRMPADIECLGGMRLYAVPIFMRGEVIGTIGFSYGDPPREPELVRSLAEACSLSYERLMQEACAYDSRPPYIVEMAKSRLCASAWLIGSLVEARQAEEEHTKLEAQFRHSQKMEAIGRLAGGVAHDFNNILQSILGYGELLVEHLSEPGETREFAREIISEAKRAASLTRQLLAFARKQEIDPKVLDLNEEVAAMLKMLRRLLSEEIELCWDPAVGQPCLVKMDVGQLDQILANLVVNARDAISGVGKVTIETRNVKVDEAFSAHSPDCRPGQYVMLAVSDDGCGMDRNTLDRLFEPFFTTKDLGKGTGLGLATVYGIVQQNHGFVNVYSEPHEGSSFKIYLPAEVPSEQPADAEASTRVVQSQGASTVLLVDDEEALLRSGRRILEGLGYTVLSAGSPAAAIRLAESYAGEIHLLLTDMVMPGMSGRDLWLKLEPLRPQMKCVFMSGYTANIIALRSIFEKGVSFLQKPFSKAALADKLQEVLAPDIRQA
jgi:PAS domain S-box-containing protein